MSEPKVFGPPRVSQPTSAVASTSQEATAFEQFQQWQKEQEEQKRLQQFMTEQERQFQEFQKWQQQQQQFEQWQRSHQQQSPTNMPSNKQHQESKRVTQDTVTQAHPRQTSRQVPQNAVTPEKTSSSGGCGLFDVMDRATRSIESVNTSQKKATSQLQQMFTAVHSLVTNFENMLGVCHNVIKHAS